MVKNETDADYLQIFSFETIPDTDTDGMLQQITHWQEVPEFKEVITIPSVGSGLSNTKIYVIDDGIGYATMCYPEER